MSRTKFRGRILYEPSGRAKETARFIAGGVKPIVVANLVRTCSHMCSYCYCPTFLKIPKERFHKRAEPKNEVLKSLEKDLEAIRKREDFDPRWLYMSFVGDPFMNGRHDLQLLTQRVLDWVRDYNMKAITLTKGTYLWKENWKAFDMAPPEDPIVPEWYGISLVSMDEAFRLEYEPGSAKYVDRLACLNEMTEFGAHGFLSMEPWPTMNIKVQDIENVLEMALAQAPKIEKIILGRWNYDARTKGHEAYYHNVAEQFESWCRSNNITFRVKDDITKAE